VQQAGQVGYGTLPVGFKSFGQAADIYTNLANRNVQEYEAKNQSIGSLIGSITGMGSSSGGGMMMGGA
jgi:hypothetical protein